MTPFLIRWLCTTIAVAVAAKLVGIEHHGLGPLIGVSLLLGIANALVRPVLLLLSLPFIVVTLGLFILVVNALLFWMVGSIVPGFAVESFWQAFGGSLIVSVVSWGLSSFFKASDGRYYSINHHTRLAGENAKRVEGRVVE